jgi:metal-responsive CopG/Arc/MetJ family transcriptional regulator
MRILIDIPEEDLKLLNDAARKLKVSRAEFVRQAIRTSLEPHRQKMTHEYFGAWTKAGIPAEDGQAYQDRMRSEW